MNIYFKKMIYSFQYELFFSLDQVSSDNPNTLWMAKLFIVFQGLFVLSLFSWYLYRASCYFPKLCSQSFIVEV
jgi:hypothetical protein